MEMYNEYCVRVDGSDDWEDFEVDANTAFLSNIRDGLSVEDVCCWLNDLKHTTEGRQILVTWAIWLLHRSTQEPCPTVF